MDMIRCPACRGSKKVAKLGGMMGDCNTCKGKGEIKECDKPVMVMAPIPEPVPEIVKAVAEAVAVSADDCTQESIDKDCDNLASKYPGQCELAKKINHAVSPEPTTQELPLKTSKPNIYKRKGA